MLVGFLPECWRAYNQLFVNFQTWLYISCMVQAVVEDLHFWRTASQFCWWQGLSLHQGFQSETSPLERALSPCFEQDGCIQVCSFGFIFTTGACRRGWCCDLGKNFLVCHSMVMPSCKSYSITSCRGVGFVCQITAYSGLLSRNWMLLQTNRTVSNSLRATS